MQNEHYKALVKVPVSKVLESRGDGDGGEAVMQQDKQKILFSWAGKGAWRLSPTALNTHTIPVFLILVCPPPIVAGLQLP